MEPKVLTSTDIDNALLGKSSALTEPQDKNRYSFETGQGELNQYDENLTPYLNKEENRASNQNAWQSMRNSVGQLVTGTLAEVISTPGYIASMFEPIEEMDKGFSGLWLEAGEVIKGFGQESMPLYQSQASHEKVFAPWDSEWMAQTIADFGPTIALVAITLATEGLATAAMLRGLSKIPGAIGNTAKLARVLKTESKFYNTLRNVNSTLLSRTAENGMEAYQTFNEVYDKLKVENPEMRDEEMRKLAGEAGSQVWKKNWALVALDYFQYKGLLEGFGKFNKFGVFGAEVTSEAGEEGMQYTFQKEAKDDVAYQLGKIDEDKNTIETFISSLSDKEMQKAMVQGALGGAVFQGAGALMDKATQALYNRQNKPLQNNIVETVAEAVEKGDDVTLVKDIDTELAKSDITPEHKTYLNNLKDTINTYKATLETVDTPYKKQVASMYAQADISSKAVEEYDAKMNVIRNNKSIAKASEAVTYAEATLARNTIDTLRGKHKDVISLEVLDKLEKKYEGVVNDAPEGINDSATKVIPLIRTNVQKKLEHEFDAERHLLLGSQVANGDLTNFQAQLKKIKVDEISVENDIDKLLDIRSNDEDDYIKNKAKTRLKELYDQEDKNVPTNIDELVPYYEKNPLTFKKYLKDNGMEGTTIEDFKNLVQTEEFKDNFVKEENNRKQDEVVKQKEQEAIDETNQPSQVKADTATKDIPVESTPIASTDEDVVEVKKTNVEKNQEDLNQFEKDLNDLGITVGENNLKESAEKVLEDVQSPFVKQVLKVLLNLISKTGTTLVIVKEGGIGYNPSQNKITIGLDTILDGFNRNGKNRSKGTTNGGFAIKYGKSEGTAVSYFATTLLHEVVHTFTSKQIDVFTGKTKGELTKEETEILNKLQKIFDLVKTNPILKGEYGLYDLHELIAEIFSNETFADKLKNISLPKELQYNTKSKNLFEGIIDLISNLITKALKGFNKQSIPNEETAFQNISNLVNDLINAKYDGELSALENKETKPQQFDITSQEEQEDLVDTKEDNNGLDSNPNRVKTTDAYVYYWDSENEEFVIPSMKGGKFTKEEFNNKYQAGKQEKGYHVLYDKDGQVIFFPPKQEPTLDIDFLRNLGQVGDVFNEPITLEVDKNYKSGDGTWTNADRLSKSNGWKDLKVAIKMQGRTIGFLGDATKVEGDPLEVAQFDQLRKTIFNNVKSSTGIYTHGATTTLKSINPPRFWQGTRTKDLLSIAPKDKPIVFGLVKNGKLFLNNADSLTDRQKEDLEGKFNLSDGAVYWLLTNPVTNKFVPYRLFTSKIKDLPDKQKRIRELFEEITEQNWKEQRNKIQSIVRWSEGNAYGPDFGYTKSGKFFIVRNGEKVYDVLPNQAYDAYVKENGYNIIDDSPVQVESDKLNQKGYNEAIIGQDYFEVNLNAGLFHSPNFRINIEPLVENKTQVVKEIVPDNIEFSIKNKNQYSQSKFIGVDGDEYFTNKRTAYYNELAKLIISNIPTVKAGHTRMWRGARVEEINKNTITTNSLVGIAIPFMYAYEGKMTYVDVPTNEVNNYLQTGAVATGAEFRLPDSYKGKFVTVDSNIFSKFEKDNPDKFFNIDVTTSWNEKEETQWFKDKIGELIDLNVVDEAEMNSLVESLKHIHGQDNVEAWGFFHNASVYALKNNRKNILFHEAYHVIENLVLTNEQIASLNKTNTEEERAELFETYVEMAQVDEAKLKQTSWYKQLGASVKRLFRKMYLAIKASVGLNLSQDEIFFRINSGAYKNNKGFTKNVDVFKPSIKAYSNNLKQQDRLSLVQIYFNQKYIQLREKLQKEGLSEKQILDKALKPTLDNRLNEDNIYYQLSIMFNDTAQDRLAKGNQYQHEEYKELSLKLYDGDVVSDRVVNKFGPLYYNALDNLKNYGIRVQRLQGDLDINDETQDSLENWMEAHPPSAYESLSKQIKMGLASLMRGEYEGENYKAERDDLGFPRFVDPFEVYSFLKDELSDSLNVEDYMERLEKLGEDIGWAKVLHQILSGSRPSTIITDIELFKAQLYQFVQEPEPTFKYLLQIIKNKKEGLFEWRFNNSASKSIANRLSQTWISNVASPLYNKIVVNDGLDEVKAQFEEKKDDNAWLYKTTNDLGIILSREAIDTITMPKKGNKRDFLKNLKEVIDSIGIDNFEQNQKVQKALVDMAKLVKKYYPEFHLPAFTNVEGETVQNYIRNSFMARKINKFKSSKHRKDAIDFYRGDKFYGVNNRTKKDESGIELRDDSYSLWLDRMQHNEAWKKMDFAVLDGQKLAGETTGTPYADLSPLEFNRMTLNAFYNNGNYKNSKSDVGKSYYSAQIMADAGSHAYIGFEAYDNEAIINKLELMAQNEYFAYLENLKEEKKTGIKGYNPKLMFIPGLIENRYNLEPEELQKKAVELVRDNKNLRKAIQENLDKIVKDTINSLEKEGLIEKDKDGYKSVHLDYRIKDIKGFVKDFVYNDFFAQTQIISLFHGKLYQYKSMEDFYKRAKEIWSPGNFIDTSRSGVNQKFVTYFVDSKSTELNYTNNKESVDAIYNNILKAGFSEDDAKKAAVGYGYTDGTFTKDGKEAVTLSNGKVIKSDSVDATDAQGIIDIYRWREIMLGKGMEKNEVERIFEAVVNDTYTIDDLSMVMNPIKQFYYTLIDVNGQVSGLQIKNSEYVLLPQIAKGNKQLENILKFLDESRKKNNGLNASINFDSAVKVGLHKVNKSLSELSIDKGILLDNNEYRIQGEVPEHQVDTTNLLGTQLRKLIMGDLNWDDVYEIGEEKINGKDLIAEWNQLLIADTWHSSERLQKEFSDPKKFYKMLQDEAVSRDYPDKFIEALTLVDGKPRLSLFHPLLTKKAQAMIGSTYRNNITKMKFNGMSTPNVAMGNEDLKIVYNADNSIKHFEAYLPLWSESLVKGMDTITPETLENLGLDLGVAYRIPTEGKYSMIPIKVKGFTNAGIVLPAEITKVAGLDYDIDKMYVMLYEFITINKKPVKVKFQKAPVYSDYEKSILYSKDIKKYLNDNNLQPSDFLGGDLVDKLLEEIGEDFLKLKNQYDSLEELLIEEELLLSEDDWNKLNVYQKNSQKARDNRKLDIIRSVLNNSKTIKAQLTPGGFDDLKAEANRIENIKGDKLDKINPMTLLSRVQIFTRMMAGKKLIGIPANYNATHALMQHNNLELTQPVLFNGEKGTNLGLLYTLGGGNVSTELVKQDIFTVKPIQAADKKAVIKASVSNKYIGYGEGITGSSTETYRQQVGKYANVGEYNNKDVVFVSIGGKRGDAAIRKQQQDKTILEALKAIESGATLITDNKQYIESSDYNEGEKKLAKNLESKGYNYSEQVVDGQTLGIWSKQNKTISTKLVSNNFAQYLASVVDNGKDPLADKYNLNTYTADVAMLMAKFFPIELGMKFIAQPSIVEFYKEYVNGGANFKAEQKATEKLLGKSYNKMMEDFIPENIDDADLEKGLTESPNATWQKKFLMHFLYYKNNQAKDLGKLVAAIKVPDSGTASSIAKTVSNIGKVKEALQLESIVGIKEFLNDENLANNSLYEKGVIDAMKKFVELGFPDEISPNSAFVNVKEKLGELKGSNLGEKEVGLINDALYSFISSAFLPLKSINTLEIIEKLPTLWNEFIKLDRKEYYALMGSIKPVTSEYDDNRNKLVLNNNQPKDIENKVMNQWENLLNSSKPINSNYTEGDLGKMLVEYAFVTNGFRFTTGSLSHIQPLSFYENLTDGTMSYDDFIEQQIKDANVNPEYLTNFVDQFVRHYFPRLSYVKSVEKEDGGIRLDEKTKEPYAVVINDFQAKDYIKYRDADSKQWYLFKLDLLTKGGTAYYNRINPLGQYRELEEWSFDSHKVESLFPENNMSNEILKLQNNFLELQDIEPIEVAESTANVEVDRSFDKNNMTIDFQEEPTTGYRNRTIKNASADATIALAVDFNSAGEKLTKSSVLGQNKKYIPINANTLEVTPERVNGIVKELNSVKAKTLNIAGNGIYTMKGKYTQKQVDDFTYDLLNQVINSPNLNTKIVSIRSGGQTGFDEAGAKASIKLGLPTIVLAPKGWTFRNLAGQDISNEQQFKARFGEVTITKPKQLNLFEGDDTVSPCIN